MNKLNRHNKYFTNSKSALHDLFDGARIMCGGFGLSGNPENCIDAIAKSGKKNLTIISNNCGNQKQGLAILLQKRQIGRVHCSYIGGNPDLEEQLLKGEVQVELNPQGTLVERIRAAGAGLGGFFTPTGAGTLVAKEKEERLIDGRPMIFETPLHADFAIIRAKLADTFGNLRFYRTSRNFCPTMAMAAKTTIVEAESICDVGQIDPDDIHLPGIFVSRIFVANDHKNPIEHKTNRPQVKKNATNVDRQQSPEMAT